MTGVLAAVAHLLNWNAPNPTYRPRSHSIDNRRKHGLSSQLSVVSTRSRARSNSHIPSSALTAGGKRDNPRKNPDFIRLLVDLNELAEDDSFCCPRNCSHCRCSPPSPFYSYSSCSSITLSPPSPSSRLQSNASSSSYYGGTSLALSVDDTGLSSSSPQGMTLSDGTSLFPLPELTTATSTIAQRRGIKELPALKPKHKPSATSLSSVSRPARDKAASPITPDTGFAQRFVGFMRLSTRPEPDSCVGPAESTHEYVKDPFGRTSSPFLYDSRLCDAPPAQHPELYDFSVYRPTSTATVPDGAHYYTEKCPKHGKARLYIGVSDIEDSPLTSTTTSDGPASNSASSRTNSGDNSKTQPHSSTGPLSRPTVPHTAPLPAESDPKASLRPLLLAQKLACRGIADAQAESVVAAATPKLRSLYLPQQLARRASHPPQRVAIPTTRSKTFLLDTGPVRIHSCKEPQQEKHPTQQPQLDGIISLLDETGVLTERFLEDSLTATYGSGDLHLATSVLVASISSPSVLRESPVKPADSRKLQQVEGILGLLSKSNSATVVPLSMDSMAGQRESSIYAYAL